MVGQVYKEIQNIYILSRASYSVISDFSLGRGNRTVSVPCYIHLLGREEGGNRKGSPHRREM